MSVVSYDFVIIVYMHSPGVTAWSEPNVIVFDLCVYLVFGCVCVCVCVCVIILSRGSVSGLLTLFVLWFSEMRT